MPRSAPFVALALLLGCGARASTPPTAPPPERYPTAEEIIAEERLSDEAWAACAARIPRQPMGDGLVAVRMTPPLVAAVAPDDPCIKASRHRDLGFYAAVRDVAMRDLPYIAVGRDTPVPRLQHPVSEDVRADEVLVELPPAVTNLGCHPVAGPIWSRVTRADAPAEPGPDAMYWIAPTELPVRFVRDEVEAYDHCEVIRAVTDVRELRTSDAMRVRIAQAVAGVDFSQQMVIFDPGEGEDRLEVNACAPLEPGRDPHEDPEPYVGPQYPPRCSTSGPLAVTTWRDADPPCQGTPPPPGESTESHWHPTYHPQLVIVPRRDGPVTRVILDTPPSPPCA
jgi:hypothetical protein